MAWDYHCNIANQGKDIALETQKDRLVHELARLNVLNDF